MAGHSKWKNIQGRKNAQDAKRGKIFQKLSREIFIAAKNGGEDVATNPALRLAVDKARAANMPNDNVERAIKKATSSTDGANYAEITYEGYGPGGVAILVETLTDNRNRTATNVRVAFNKNGGSLGETGSVNYLFDRKGYLAIERAHSSLTEEELFEKVLDLGAEDFVASEEGFEIYSAPENFVALRDALEQEMTLTRAELAMIPQTTIALSDDQQQQLDQLIEKLEDDDDVTEVYTSAEVS